MERIRRRHSLTNVWILWLEALVNLQVSAPYRRTDLTSVKKSKLGVPTYDS
jgi:hypothetical protein